MPLLVKFLFGHCHGAFSNSHTAAGDAGDQPFAVGLGQIAFTAGDTPAVSLFAGMCALDRRVSCISNQPAMS